MNNIGRAEIAEMLRGAHDDVNKHYFNPKLNGVDWDARYRQYEARVATARSFGDGFRLVAAFLSGLHDSHTFFIPPQRAERFEPGFRMMLSGPACYVARVRPNTDAAEKLHVGDRVLKVDGYDVNRSDFHDLQYYYQTLAPQSGFLLEVQAPSGDHRQVTVQSTITNLKRTYDLSSGDGGDIWELMRQEENGDHLRRPELREIGDAAVLKLQNFDRDQEAFDRLMDKARKHPGLVLDLRGNPGGSVDQLEWVVASLFEHDVKIADRVGRKSLKPLIAKHHGQDFKGKLVVLVDAGSASASELLARVVQLEHRGAVIGDRTEGAVMEAKIYPESQGADTQVFYDFSVTDANLLMSDGESLENVGVTPDEELLPSQADLAAGRDPVLARAAQLVGAKLDATEAGKLFPIEWLPL